MRIVLLHGKDAVDPPPEDPVLAQIETALRAAGHECARIAVDDTVEPVVHELRVSEPELVFNLTESFGGKSSLDSNIAGLLNLLGLRYTGSSPAGLLIAGDKSVCKKVLSFHGIRIPQFATVYRGNLDWAGDIAFPLIVKPPQEDASIGITSRSVVHDVKELFGMMDEIHSTFQSPVLVEQFIDGREFYVGVLGNERPTALPIIEMDFSKFPADTPRVASWDAKWETESAEYGGTVSIFPENLSEELTQRIQAVAIESFQAFRLRDYARVDMRVTDSGDIYVIEVNPNCYLEKEAEFARAAERSGIQYNDLIARIVELAGARYSR